MDLVKKKVICYQLSLGKELVTDNLFLHLCRSQPRSHWKWI